MKAAALIGFGILAIIAVFFLYRSPLEIVPNTLEAVVTPVSTSTEIYLPPEPLKNPPAVVKALYVTGWTAGHGKSLDRLIQIIKANGMNGIVVDLKDYSGYVSYRIDNPLLREVGALDEPRILKPDDMLKKLHDQGIYVIGRITVFQDPVLAAARKDWAIQNKATGGVWRDRNGLSWMDPSIKDVWEYNLIIANDAFGRGFDEINFDYIRFPSDGNIKNIVYPAWKEDLPKSEVIRGFFEYIRAKLPGKPISADIFGLTTVKTEDIGVGQIIEDAYRNFDYVSPMVYPSHYGPGFLGYKNPADYPYEVVKYSMIAASERMASGSSSVSISRLRPWLQAFDLGAVYDRPKIEAQIRAVEDAFASSTASLAGWVFWDPSNRYGAFNQ